MIGCRSLFIAAILVSTVTATLINFSINFRCPNIGKEWCFDIKISEVDYIADDVIQKHHACTKDQSYQLGIVHDHKGDGKLDGTYELLGFVRHNCATDNEYHIYRIKDNTVQTSSVKTLLNWRYDLTDLGNTEEEEGLLGNIR